MAETRPALVIPPGISLRIHRRRDLLKLATLGGICGMFPGLVAGCNGDVTDPTVHATFDFGSDLGALNFAYAYTQFMTEFYARVTSYPFVGITTNEVGRMRSISRHKLTQRNTLQILIPSGRITDVLLFNFGSMDFSSRSAVMGFAQTFEDLGVAVLNGAAPQITNATNLTLLGKVKSVWARHAEVIRDLNDIAAGTSRTGFAGTVDVHGLDQTATMSAALTQMQPYVLTTLSTSGAA